ncbi:hypothetical protein Vadar_007187 [Vaccinium darrowii]|uniref:Uncharacterized protein n=1 Tax=Vaccinium darrowii TaxID=229202 RepID=A0ACB7YUK0_9ERIC|nr:hypothetical protein Vadar_007187 [Vaccinium darrowii]
MAGKGERSAIGIDLGTTYSCVGYWKNDRVKIIANSQGKRKTPSYVSFTDTRRLIGDDAKNRTGDPANTVFVLVLRKNHQNSNGNLVMGQVTILRRGESLDSTVNGGGGRRLTAEKKTAAVDDSDP